MTHLNIQQGSNVEIVTALIIKKLYDAALSVPEPLSGEEDAAYMSGNLLVNKAYRSLVEYLTNRFDDLSINVTVAYYIDFEDVNVLNALLAGNFSSDGIGITTTDAATATFSNNQFRNNTYITSFNTFNLFTKANNNPPKNLFKGCTNLASVNLSNVTKLNECEFEGTALTTVVIPEGVEYIAQCCFSGCSNLSSVSLPLSCITLNGGCFQNCANLTSIDLSNITSIYDQSAFEGCGLSGELNIPNLTGILGNRHFKNCKKLTSITNLGNITAICPYARYGYGEGCFTNCSSLTSVTFPNTLTILGTEAFAGCNNLSLLGDLSNITTIGSACFDGHPAWNFILNLPNVTKVGVSFIGKTRSSVLTRLVYLPKVNSTDTFTYYSDSAYYMGNFAGITADIIYLRDISSFYPGDFSNCICSALVINNITPPIWKNKNNMLDSEIINDPDFSKDRVFSNSTISNIYVPDSAVSTYQTDTNWSSVANKIQPLSYLTKVATEADLLANQIALIEAYM